MDSIETLQPGTILSNDELREIFKCSPQGGMRRSHETNTLVIVTNHIESIYEDRWEGDVIHYTGMGQKGPMQLSFAQNKTLSESPANGVAVHLFEVFRKGEYTYVGEVERSGEPYQATQPDVDGNERLAWLFPLQLKSHETPAIDGEKAREAYQRREKRAARLADDELKKRAMNAPTIPGSRPAVAMQYARSPEVSEYAKRRANGYCELCEQPAPFQSKSGEPYLECHHIEWLARGGEDTIENTVALCPNCHRKMHVIGSHADQEKLKATAAQG
ncbi:5-methylcytosine-specific restriction enzyme A [Modicisalibacter muralis]|uniref:5-methylcytosine-specific restriction enzyme A n=1 Tax=Modicisalibacter muralis TaxID=119000 RepID=A0A1G9EMN2_9GAMM|nr:HNH endonuclease signature motif containing protein [Halomonas muralis]SDK77386.1 5-methylcytosine-specific restriction enzyme A [Halomonas muralis]